jgi:hypothetical protein
MNNRWIEYAINVTLKINRGSFGIKYDRQGEFRFCARSRSDAVAIAGHHVKGAATSIDTTRMVEIVGAVPLPPQRSDECLYDDHDLCHFVWCNCPHHSRVQFETEHPQLISLFEADSELEAELEVV